MKHLRRNIKDLDAWSDINNHLGNGKQTNTNPFNNVIDEDRIFSKQPDGTWHSIRIGDHEMRKAIGKGFYYHLEKWDMQGKIIRPDESVNVIKTRSKDAARR